MLLNSLSRDMFKPFCSHRCLLTSYSGRVLEVCTGFLRGFLQRGASMRALWPDRQNRSHDVSQKFTLARNQYMNNFVDLFPVFARVRIQARHASAPKWIPLRICTAMRKSIPPKRVFPVFARVRMQAPHVFTQKIIPKNVSCMYWFCAGRCPRNNQKNETLEEGSTKQEEKDEKNKEKQKMSRTIKQQRSAQEDESEE